MMDYLDKLGELLEEALNRPPDEREAFLDAACEGNADLRGELVSLLEANARAEGFFEDQAILAHLRPLSQQLLGDRLLGEGLQW